MKRPLRSTLVIVTISLLVAGGLAVSAQGGRGAWGPGTHGGPGMHGGDGHGPMAGIMRQLGLTEQQRDQVHARIDEAMDGELGRLMREHQQKRDVMRQLIHDPSTDESAIADAVRDATADAESLALAKHRLAVSLFDVLTPEQREQALELLADPAHRRTSERRMHRGRIDPDPRD